MALNLSSAGKTSRLSFGGGILYVGAAGATPSTDVGYARGAQLSVTRSKLTVLQGVPRTFITQFANEESIQLQFTGLEWNLDHLQKLLGAGRLTNPGAATAMGFGGDINFSQVAVRYVHQLPGGQTAECKIWKGLGMGEMQLNFGEDLHEFGYTFQAIDSATRWDGTANQSDERLLRIELTGSF
jgi:hypothetical protein